VNCSEGESCIPDGIKVAGDAVKDIIARLCEQEFNCCDENELRFKFGEGIPDAETCTETFTDLVNSGYSPDFLESNAAVVAYVIDVAQAINNSAIKVAINQDGIEECLDMLEARECNKFQPPAEPGEAECDPDVSVGGAVPCSPAALVSGKQAEGEQCGILNVPECDEGLICRKDTAGCQDESDLTACVGLCAKAAEVDDTCTKDSECESVANDLFCNRSENKCQERGDEGDDCAYVNIETENVPPYSNSNLNPGWVGGFLQNPAALSLECKAGLTCDPLEQKCVSRCSTGYLCYAGGVGGVAVPVPSLNCPQGDTCNVTENPGLRTWGLGVCRPTLDIDDACTAGYHECETDRCVFDFDAEGDVCAAPLKAEGESCTLGTAGQTQGDATCGGTMLCVAQASNSTAGQCATRCSVQADCPSTHFCNNDVNFGGLKPYYCELKLVNDPEVSCTTEFEPPNQNVNFLCASGFCQVGTSTCADKVAAGGACTQHSACMAGQYCDFTLASPVCTDHPAIGETCIPGSKPCDWTEGATCVDVDGEFECVEVLEFPLKAACGTSQYLDGKPYFGDQLCASGWCANEEVCADPIAEDGDCDVEDPLQDRCVAGLYCDHPAGDSAGTCQPKHFVGEDCNPRFRHADCIGLCVERSDRFVCDDNSLNFLEDEVAFCDGE
jgi:hypothetical protein